MSAAVVALLVLHPVVADDGWLRLVASGVEGDVVWSLDGLEVARTLDREATLVHVGAGEHQVEARAAGAGRWHAVVRLDGGSTGAAFVPAWSATYEPVATSKAEGSPTGGGPPLVPLGLAVAAALALAWPNRRPRRRRAPVTKGP